MSIEKSGYEEFIDGVSKIEREGDDIDLSDSSGCCASGTQG